MRKDDLKISTGAIQTTFIDIPLFLGSNAEIKERTALREWAKRNGFDPALVDQAYELTREK